MTTPAVTGRSLSMLQLATQEVWDEYRTYDPPNMAHVGAELKGVAPAIRSLAAALQHLSITGQLKHPVHSQILQALVDVYVRTRIIADKADSLYPDFLTVHKHDVGRYENPRKGYDGERKWNIVVGQQTDGIGIRSRPSVLMQRCEHVAHAYCGRYEPEHMMRVYAEYCAIAKSIENIAATIGILADRAQDRYPLHQSIRDQLSERVNDLYAAASEAAKLMPAFRRLHSRDLAKHETPRTGEQQWDV